jgi:tetraprenyl-beta-curcumene synthase
MAAGERAIWRDLVTTTGTVLLRPSRFVRLVKLGPAGWAHMARFLGSVVPNASRRLAALRERASRIPDPRLRAEALASIDLKAYHVQGGSILATFLRGEHADRFISIVVPLETIYDYLDNLCDRLGDVPANAFVTLHEALTDALDPEAPARDYYRDGPALDDGGYLRSLVDEVRAGVVRLPNYRPVASRTREAAAFYSELQALKHLPASEREPRCQRWYAEHRERFPDLYWWEFAAACGSSLPVFAMLFLASEPDLAADDVAATFDAYFPNVSAVHILLDYFIDQAEDREHRELNFVACYATLGEAVDRVRGLVGQAARRVRTIAHAEGHSFLLNAMCLFYLTHPKVFAQRLDSESAALLGALR